MTYRPMTWTEKVLADHADEQYGYDLHFAARAEVERSKEWYAWERFSDAMSDLIRHILEISNLPVSSLDTRERIRDYGPSADRGSAIKWEEPRQ